MSSTQVERNQELIQRREVMRQLHADGGITDRQRQRGEGAFARLLAKTNGTKRPHLKTVVGLFFIVLSIIAVKYAPTAAASAGCQVAPAPLVGAIDKSFTGGQHLARTAAVASGGFIYIGGDIVGADGRVVSSRNTWAVDDTKVIYVMYAISKDARKMTTWPDGRDIVPDYLAALDAVSDCVGKL